MKGCTKTALHAVIWPKHLGTIGHFNAGKRIGLMGAGKGGMPRRVPILGEDHRVKISHAVVNLFYNLITAGNRQSAARTKVVLNINHNQSTHLDPLSKLRAQR